MGKPHLIPDSYRGPGGYEFLNTWTKVGPSDTERYIADLWIVLYGGLNIFRIFYYYLYRQ